MTDRITPAMVTSQTLSNVTSALNAIERSSEELSSGKTILEPSDNPYGASRVIDLQSQLEGLSSYEGNAQNGIEWENTASSAMSSMDSSVQKVRELVLQAANGTANQGDRETIALQVEQLTESIKQDANTKFGNEFVFSGTATLTSPYQQGENDEYQGNTEAISSAVGPGATVTISTDLSSVLGNGAKAEDGKLLDTLRTIVKNLRGGTPEDIEEVSTTNLQSLDKNREALVELQAVAGSATNQLQAAVTRNEDLQSSITQALSATDATNVAATSIAYANEQAAYQAALHAGATIVQESLLNFLN